MNQAFAAGEEDRSRYAATLEQAKDRIADMSEETKHAVDELVKLAEARQMQVAQQDVLNRRLALINDLTSKGSAAVQKLTGAVKSFSGLNFPTTIGEAASEFMRLTTELDASRAALVKTTGFTQKYTKDLNAASLSARRFGGSFTEGSEAIAGLNKGMTLFATLNTDQRRSLQDTSIALAAMGVDAADTGRAMDLLTRGMNMGADGALEAVKDFDKLAQSVGLPTTQIVSDFVAMGPQLAKFGRRGTQVFANMQRQARRLGLDVKQAFELEQQFETFEGASEMAGKLNAQIGLRLNSIKLMKAEEGERIQMMREEFAARGKNFGDMSRWQQKSIAQILNVDVSAAERIFGTPADLAKYQAEQKTLEERARAMTDAMKTFKGALEEVFVKLVGTGVIQDFATYLKDMANTLNKETIQGWGNTFTTVMNFAKGLVGLMVAGMVLFGVKLVISTKNTLMLYRALQMAANEAQRLAMAQAGTTGVAGGPMGWNQYQKANAGKGMTPAQMSAGYQAQKTGGAATGAAKGASRFGGAARMLGGLGIAAGGMYGAGMLGESIGGTAGMSTAIGGSVLSGALGGFMLGGPVGALIGALGGAAVGGYQAMGINNRAAQTAPTMQDGIMGGKKQNFNPGDLTMTVAGTKLIKTRREEKQNRKEQAEENAAAMKPLFRDLLASNEKVANRPVRATVSKTDVGRASNDYMFGRNGVYGMFNTV
jgi:hypothetical protein